MAEGNPKWNNQPCFEKGVQDGDKKSFRETKKMKTNKISPSDKLC